jgi:hypothetical protein
LYEARGDKNAYTKKKAAVDESVTSEWIFGKQDSIHLAQDKDRQQQF